MCFIYAVYNKQSSHVYSECYLLYLLKCVIQRKNVVWNMLFAHKFNIYEVIKNFLCLFFKLKLYLLLFFFISKKLDASFSYLLRRPPSSFLASYPWIFGVCILPSTLASLPIPGKLQACSERLDLARAWYISSDNVQILRVHVASELRSLRKAHDLNPIGGLTRVCFPASYPPCKCLPKVPASLASFRPPPTHHSEEPK